MILLHRLAGPPRLKADIAAANAAVEVPASKSIALVRVGIFIAHCSAELVLVLSQLRMRETFVAFVY